MRTNKIPSVRCAHRSSFQRGFTLIEILVVLIIVAIITAVAVLAFGHFGRGRREKIIVNQFVRVIGVAQQQAILTPDVLGLGITSNGYHFYQYEISLDTQKGKWEPVRNDVLSHRTAFKKVFDVNVKSISGYESSEPKNNDPTILFLPSGFVTPFELALNGASHHFLISVKNNGVVSVISN